jgi:hypothetical protein
MRVFNHLDMAKGKEARTYVTPAFPDAVGRHGDAVIWLGGLRETRGPRCSAIAAVTEPKSGGRADEGFFLTARRTLAYWPRRTPENLRRRHENFLASIARNWIHRIPVLFESLDGGVRTVRRGTPARFHLGSIGYLRREQFRDRDRRRSNRLYSGRAAAQTLAIAPRRYPNARIHIHSISAIAAYPAARYAAR